MRLFQRQTTLIPLSSQTIDHTEGRDLLWQHAQDLDGFSPGDSPLHLGQFISHIRTQLGLDKERLVDRVAFGRRSKRLKWLSSLEASGHCPLRAKDEFIRALNVSESQLLDWKAYAGLDEAIRARVPLHSRLIQQADDFVELHFTSSSLKEERRLLAENLSFLMENNALINAHNLYRHCLLSQAYVSTNARSKYAFGSLAKSRAESKESTWIALPLGLLLKSWSQGRLLLEETSWREPLHVVRLLQDDHLPWIWVEGILRKSRRWVQSVIPNEKSPPGIQQCIAQAKEEFEDQTPRLWSNFRRYSGYHSTLARFQRVSGEGLDDSAWMSEMNLPGWVDSWSSQAIPRLRQSWVDMAHHLSSICQKPLWDSIWSTGAPGFDWIPCRSESHWESWRQRMSAGVNDHRARKYTEESFAQCLHECATTSVEVRNLAGVINEIKSIRDGRAVKRGVV